MLLSHLLQNISPIPPDIDRDITSLTLDSRKVHPASVFIAIQGAHVDGRKYISNAISAGASTILVDANSEDLITLQNNVPVIPVNNLQQKLGEIAANFYGHPANQLRMLGVTGTNGKTSCTHFIAQILASLRIHCGIIGTLGSGFYQQLNDTGFTTPDAITLQAILANFVKQKANAVAMEVSSHSIHQGRINSIPFEIGIFTNLTQDHLDYHGDMQTYADVKKSFLTNASCKQVVINADDEYGARFIRELSSHKKVYAYTTETNLNLEEIDVVRAENINLTLNGIKATVKSPWGEGELQLPLIGKFNLSNALAVLTTLCVYGIPLKDVLSSFQQISSVPGRMQILGGRNKPLVVVDYAHTPDALEKTLSALRAHVSGKLICVFGCGGDRDHDKRPRMAQIAERLADKVIVTNDNPRHEQPEEIAKQIMQGFHQPHHVSVLLDRSKAIENSIQCASIDDCILVAGKGAERYQQIGDEKIPYDDVEKVTEYLATLSS